MHAPLPSVGFLIYIAYLLTFGTTDPGARYIYDDLDERQSAGVYNVRFPSFDRITFDWNGRAGAKITVRFNCLSTDFSRIKGVKGIPLRAHMETQVLGLGLEKSLEQCYCKIKLFRDKVRYPFWIYTHRERCGADHSLCLAGR